MNLYLAFRRGKTKTYFVIHINKSNERSTSVVNAVFTMSTWYSNVSVSAIACWMASSFCVSFSDIASWLEAFVVFFLTNFEKRLLICDGDNHSSCINSLLLSSCLFVFNSSAIFFEIGSLSFRFKVLIDGRYAILRISWTTFGRLCRLGLGAHPSWRVVKVVKSVVALTRTFPLYCIDLPMFTWQCHTGFLS